MRRIFRLYIATIAVVLAATGILLSTVAGYAASDAAAAEALSPQARQIYKKAFRAGDKNRWTQALALAKKGGNPLAGKILTWMRLRAPNSGAAFEEIVGFMSANPTWPDLQRLRRRAEEAIDPTVPAAAILGWFDRFPPISPDGAFQFARTLLDANRQPEAERVIHEAWTRMEMGRTQARDFRKRFQKHIRRKGDVARLEALLWRRQVRAARRQMRYVGKDWRRLGQARISLMIRSRKAQRVARKVPKTLRGNPGLFYDQVRWHRRREKMEKAIALLLERRPTDLVRPTRWWRERASLARWALREEQPELAYRVASSHWQRDGESFADAEWLSGWIALRRLQNNDAALRHFQNMFAKVSYPVSRARGAYWTARAYEALEQHEAATEWYRKAAQHGTRFYGQLAAGHLLERERPTLPLEDDPDAAATRTFEANETVRAIRILGALDRRDGLKRFLVALAGQARVAADWTLAARLAQDVGRHDLGVYIAKKALREGVVLSTTGYPALVPANAADADLPDAAVVYALVRQESAFDTHAVSRAGARGLMQLMPGTALRVARRLKVPYSRRRLTRDPQYNMRLGQAYLGNMLEDYDGSLILALSAYNAGPLRVERWLRRHGDPGPNIYAAIDWIESIPFTETRNYVQRVLENLTVYRSRENGLNSVLTQAMLEPGPFKDSAGRVDRFGASSEQNGEDFAGP